MGGRTGREGDDRMVVEVKRPDLQNSETGTPEDFPGGKVPVDVVGQLDSVVLSD